MCSASLCCVRFDFSEFMTPFYGFNLCSVSGLNFLSLVVVFNFSVAILLLPCIDLICSQAHILQS